MPFAYITPAKLLWGYCVVLRAITFCIRCNQSVLQELYIAVGRVRTYEYRACVSNVYEGARFCKGSNDFSRTGCHSKPVRGRPKTCVETRQPGMGSGKHPLLLLRGPDRRPVRRKEFGRIMIPLSERAPFSTARSDRSLSDSAGSCLTIRWI